MDRMKAGNFFGVANGPVVSYSSEFFPKVGEGQCRFLGVACGHLAGIDQFRRSRACSTPLYNKTLFCLEVGAARIPGHSHGISDHGG